MAETRVARNEAEHRYEVFSGDERAGFTEYTESGDQVVFVHTEIDDAFGGQGLGKILARQALDDVIERGKAIVPVCPFIASFVRRNPEYQQHVRQP